MSTGSNRCIFIGLPNSGKSSFIGALWHVVESGEIDTLYSVYVQPEDREYLNSLRTSFLNCVPVERTKMEFAKRIELEVVEGQSGKRVTFIFPDLSGETFESQFEYRKITKEYLDQVAECSSIMMFVNPDFLKKSTQIHRADEMLDFDTLVASIDQTVAPNSVPLHNRHKIDNIEVEDRKVPVESVSTGQQQSKTEAAMLNDEIPTSVEKLIVPQQNEESKWTPKHCQTQVVLIDLLQIIKKSLKIPCKINIIISAWDVVKSLPSPECDVTPNIWLMEHLPMLYQFLESNIDIFSFVIYGISAQGGEYAETAAENVELQSQLRQSERIIVQHEHITHSDITAPLKWIFE